MTFYNPNPTPPGTTKVTAPGTVTMSGDITTSATFNPAFFGTSGTGSVTLDLVGATLDGNSQYMVEANPVTINVSGDCALGGSSAYGVLFAQTNAPVAIDVAAGAELTVGAAGYFYAYFPDSTLTLAGSSAGFVNDGIVDVAYGFAESGAGTLVNNGQISLIWGDASFASAITGTGTISHGADAGALDLGAVGAGETVLIGKALTLGADDLAGGLFEAKIVGFGVGATIDLGTDQVDHVSWDSTDDEAVFSYEGTQLAGGLKLSGLFDPSSLFLDTSGTTAILHASSGGINAPACFARGTRILTPRGLVAVESLRAGEAVLTLNDGARDVVWIGRRHVACAHDENPAAFWPVRFCAGALADGVPVRDVRVSPEHRIFIDGALVPARCLVNATSVVQEEVDEITYFHVELASHDILLAEGMPAESWLDTGNRDGFGNAPVVALRPRFVAADGACARAGACAPLLEDGEALAAMRRWLSSRATALGFGGVAAFEMFLDECGQHRGEVPADAAVVRLVSTACIPRGERRRLGAAVAAIRIDGADMALTDPRIRTGFHPIEGTGGPAWRWTNGDGVIAIGTAAVARCIEIRVVAFAAGAARYA